MDTGMELDFHTGELAILASVKWQERRQRWFELGGPPLTSSTTWFLLVLPTNRDVVAVDSC